MSKILIGNLRGPAGEGATDADIAAKILTGAETRAALGEWFTEDPDDLGTFIVGGT